MGRLDPAKARYVVSCTKDAQTVAHEMSVQDPAAPLRVPQDRPRSRTGQSGQAEKGHSGAPCADGNEVF